MRRLGLGFLADKIFDPIHAVFGRSHRFLSAAELHLKINTENTIKAWVLTLSKVMASQKRQGHYPP
jgi:hypothetical protein